MYALRLALKNVISRKSSLVIILFISFAIALLFVSNAVFDGTDHGLERTFINSFTGNIVLRPKVDFPLSLFGDETPVTGKLSEIPTLVPYAKIKEAALDVEGVRAIVPQITGYAAVNVNDKRVPISLFGVPGEQYTTLMSSIKIVEGRVFKDGEAGLLLNTDALARINKAAGVKLGIGSDIQLLNGDGVSFSIRSVPLLGIYTYDSQNPTLSGIALLSPQTLRDLIGMQDFSDSVEIDESQINLIEDDSSIDDLFGNSQDFDGEEALDGPVLAGGDSAAGVGAASGDGAGDAFAVGAAASGDSGSAGENVALQAESSVWSYLICMTDASANEGKIIKQLNKVFKENEWAVQAVNWRDAAGGSVYISFYLRIIFNIGIVLILLTGFIVVNNTLTVSSISRIGETGTIRALGAKRGFVIREFLCETSLLTITSGIIGCLLGCLFTFMLQKAHIGISNTYLAQLFGGKTLTAAITASNAIQNLALSVVLAVVGCVYPVRVALRATPVEAMRRQV
ncbi:MAG: FtsX-like permease family protein [Treponema sp.]|nr:FtsX-like permease family protein [Treponema sp.]MBQ1726015.1 FtsX-like permease family protein [Treponema sp.]MBQ5432443.1 FtsX-like permease family protein [Treponema sp.]